MLTAVGVLVKVTAADNPWLRNNPAENTPSHRVSFTSVQNAVAFSFIINLFAFENQYRISVGEAHAVGKPGHSCTLLCCVNCVGRKYLAQK